MKIPLKDVVAFVRDERGIDIPENAAVHLGVSSEPYLSHIYGGEKTLESRFARNRIAPYGRIRPGDTALIKRASGPVEAAFVVGKVWDTRSTRWTAAVREVHGNGLCVCDEFWRAKAGCRYATVIEIRELVKFDPFWVEKRGQAAWLELR